ncbi:MAG: hypothetical protein ACQKBV_00385 [Puniceicoccales bacterium]
MLKAFVSLCCSLVCVVVASAHPADTNQDGRVSAGELATYVGQNGPDSELSLQGVNIWKFGELYSTLIDGADTYYVPNPADGRRFVALETLNPVPATMIKVVGLPDNPAGYVAYYQVGGLEEVTFDTTIVADNGENRLVVPPHPLTPMLGGELSYAIYPAGTEPTVENSFYSGQLSVQGLTAAPNELQALRGKVNQLVDRLGQRNGVDYSAYFTGGIYENGPFNSEAELAQIAAIRYLADPDFPGGFVELEHQILSGDDPAIVSLREQVNALIAQAGVTDFIDEYLDQFEADGGPGNFQASARLARSGSEDFLLDPNPTDGASLNQLMREQYVAEQMLTESIFSPEVGAVTAAMSLAGAPGKVAAAPISVTITGLKVEYEAMANTYPSEGKLNAEFTRKEYFQDQCDQAGEWTATAVVKSKGWSIDGVATDVALTAIGAGGAAADGIKAFKAAGAASNAADAVDTGVRTALINKSIETAQTGTDFIRDEALKKYQEQNTSNEVPSKTWTVPVKHPYARMIQGGQPVLNILEFSYLPINVGTVNAYIQAESTGANAFPGGRLQSSNPEQITVREARVLMSGCPPSQYEPGEEYTISAEAVEVGDLGEVSFRWEATGGTISNITSVGAGRSQAVWTAPDPAPPGLITITATAEFPLCVPVGGAFPEGNCVTSGTNFELRFDPVQSCYEPGELISLEMVNLNDPSSPPNVDFDLVTGVSIGQLNVTGVNTATITASETGEVGFTATPNGQSAQMQFGAFTFGCGEPLSMQIQVADGIAVVGFSIDQIQSYTIYGSFSAANGRVVMDFNAADHHAYVLSQLDEDDEPPPFGTVGFNAANFSPIVIPNFSLRVEFDYTEDGCDFPMPVPFTTCLNEANPENTIDQVVGLASDYALDPFLAGSKTGVDGHYVYNVNLIPVQ